MVTVGSAQNDGIKLLAGAAYMGLSSVTLWFWDWILQQSWWVKLNSALLVAATVANNMALTKRLTDDIPDVQQLDELMMNTVWSLTMPMQIASLCNCELLVAVALEAVTLCAVWQLPARGIGHHVLLHGWTICVAVTNVWSGFTQARRKRETFLLLLAASVNIHEDNLELLHSQFECISDDAEKIVEEDPLLKLPELRWEQSYEELNQHLSPLTVRFYKPHLNEMYCTWHFKHRRQALNEVIWIVFVIEIAAMLVWIFYVQPREDRALHTVRGLLPLCSSYLGGALCLNLIAQRLNAKWHTLFWNVLLCYSVFMCVYFIGRGMPLQILHDPPHERDELVILNDWGLVVFGYSIALAILNTVGAVSGCDFLLIASNQVLVALAVGVSLTVRGFSAKVWIFVVFLAAVHIAGSYHHIRVQKMQALWQHWQMERFK